MYAFTENNEYENKSVRAGNGFTHPRWRRFLRHKRCELKESSPSAFFPPEHPVELSPSAQAGELPTLDPVEARVDGDLVRDHHRVEARVVRRVPERVKLHAAHVAREAAFGVRDLHDGA